MSMQPASPRRRLHVAVVALVVALIAAGAAVAATDPFASTPSAGSGASDNGYATSTATVERQPLTSQTEVNATLGYGTSQTVAIPSGTAPSAVSADETTVSTDELKVATDQQTLASARALAAPNGASTLLGAQSTVRGDEATLRSARNEYAADRRLGCPAASSATVSSAASAATSTGSSTNDGSSGTGASATTSPSTGGSPSEGGAKDVPSGTTGSATSAAGNTGAETAFIIRPALGTTGDAGGAGTTGSGPTTTTTQPPSAPSVTTGTADKTGATSATVMGEIDPGGAATTYDVEYGTSADYGATTTGLSAGSGTTPIAASVTLTDLLPGETYYYRFVATNSVGTDYGSQATFATTAPPVAITGTATSATATSETLSGSLDPGGLDTTYHFEFGRSSSFGRTTPTVTIGGGSGSASITVVVTKLKADTTYEFRLVASNALGSSVGITESFASAASSCVAQAAIIGEDADALRTASDALAADRIDSGASVTADEVTLTGDEQALATARTALVDDETTATNPGATITSLPAAGATITRGATIYRLDSRPVPLFYGAVTPYRALYLGVTPGADVTELDANLIALGFGDGLVAGPDFSVRTEAAVKAWQSSLGLQATGIVRLGDLVVAPGPVKVATVTASPGGAATGGTAVLTYTSTAPLVTIALDAAEQDEVRVGDAVTITLPNNTTTPGIVSAIGSVATASSGSGNTGSSSGATISVEVTPTDPKATGGLDQAPVEVSITTASVASALVVPVDALLALAGGGYALEVVGTDGIHTLEAVTLGLFDDAAGLVQVTGSEVRVGQRVVVPAL